LIFSEVTEIKIEKLCFIVLTGGRRLTGYLKSEKPGFFIFTDTSGTKEEIPLQDLVVLDELDKRFWKRVSGNIDVSYNLTKANNTSQFTVGGGLYYRGPVWQSSFTINSLNSNQDNAEEITRTDMSADVTRILPRNWYLLANYSFLSNTEQALESRNSVRAGLGRFVALTNKLLWGLNVGVNLNFESFSDLTPDNESTELYIGSQFDMFDFSDWSLKTNINVFPSFK
jgi:hypothetical protein